MDGTDGRSALAIVMAQVTIPDAESNAIEAAPQATVAEGASDLTDDRTAAEAPTPLAETTNPLETVVATEAKPAQAGDEALNATAPAEPTRSTEIAAPPVPNDAGNAAEMQQTSEPVTPAQVTPTIAEPRATEATPVGGDIVKPAPTVDPAKPVAPPIKAADQPIKRAGQVAVFVSRKEQKIFVRQGFVPLFDMPVVIDQPDQPLGTHVFTAMEVTENGSGMRWNLMTVPTDLSAPMEQRDTRKKSKASPKPAARFQPPPTAAEALHRIQMPQEAVERISELLIPGSSLVVSDEGLGRETGRYTEFIVLTR
jgi:hypothetical protein